MVTFLTGTKRLTAEACSGTALLAFLWSVDSQPLHYRLLLGAYFAVSSISETLTWYLSPPVCLGSVLLFILNQTAVRAYCVYLR